MNEAVGRKIMYFSNSDVVFMIPTSHIVAKDH